MRGRIDGLRRVSESAQFDTHKMQKLLLNASQADPQTLRRYRDLRGDLRPTLVAVRRAAVLRVFRVGLLAIVFLVALRVLAGFVFGFVDRFLVVAFFFGDAAADFALPVVRFLAASIAAPERPPITVPTTGTPNAVPTTAPAAAPPTVLPAVPMAVSVAL
jgi:hypothetical protein